MADNDTAARTEQQNSGRPLNPAGTDVEDTWTGLLIDQIEWHWRNQLRPRLDGLTTQEYFWEPVPTSWNVHPRGHGYTEMQGGAMGEGGFTIDFAFPEPEPAPVTTIAWRLGHVIVGVLGARNHSHFDGPPADYMTWTYAGTADEALAQLDDAYERWIEGVRGWSEDDLRQPCGPMEGPWAEDSRARLVLHIHRELIHHGAEIALLRDLYAHRAD